MKIQFEEQELNYLTNMIRAAEERLASAVETHKIMKRLSDCFEPPRSYVQLSPADRQSLVLIVKNAKEFNTKVYQEFNDKTSPEVKEHNTNVRKILTSIAAKLGGAANEPSAAKI